MSACVPAGTTDSAHTERAHPPHSPPPPGRPRRFRIAGADLSAAIAVFLIALPCPSASPSPPAHRSRPAWSRRPWAGSSPDGSAAHRSR